MSGGAEWREKFNILNRRGSDSKQRSRMLAVSPRQSGLRIRFHLRAEFRSLLSFLLDEFNQVSFPSQLRREFKPRVRYDKLKKLRKCRLFFSARVE